MNRKINLQTRLITAFFIMGLIVFIVAWMGWSGTSRLSQHLDTIGKNNLPSVEALWKVNEGQTQIESSERSLLDITLSLADRRNELARMDAAWKQIDSGFKQYDVIPRSEDENKLYKQMLMEWDTWKKAHQEVIRINQEFEKIGILNPFQLQIDLLSQNKSNTAAMTAAKTAGEAFNKLNTQIKANKIPFKISEASIVKLAEMNRNESVEASKIAEKDISQTNFWVFIGMIIGPLTAIILGIGLSIAIAKPLDRAIGGIINQIVSSATEIAAAIEQQERIANQQASAVNQTTTTMDELSASSEKSAEQAEGAATGAYQVLSLVDRQKVNTENQIYSETENSLKEQVKTLGDCIVNLNQQTNQIGTISTAVSELANQTNMLALNAAVEAVRAGENGRGFAVVAAEIRKLADRSRKSAEQITSLVTDIQKSTNSTVIITEEGIKSVAKIVNAINKVVINSQQIALTSKQQSVAINQVVSAMNNINIGAQQTAKGISQTKIGIQKLNESAQNLKNLGVG